MLAYCPTCSNMLLGGRERALLAVLTLVWSPCVAAVTLKRLLPLLLPATAAALLRPNTVELSEFTKELRYCCQTCPYIYTITKKVRQSRPPADGPSERGPQHRL